MLPMTTRIRRWIKVFHRETFSSHWTTWGKWTGEGKFCIFSPANSIVFPPSTLSSPEKRERRLEKRIDFNGVSLTFILFFFVLSSSGLPGGVLALPVCDYRPGWRITGAKSQESPISAWNWRQSGIIHQLECLQNRSERFDFCPLRFS